MEGRHVRDSPFLPIAVHQSVDIAVGPEVRIASGDGAAFRTGVVTCCIEDGEVNPVVTIVVIHVEVVVLAFSVVPRVEHQCTGRGVIEGQGHSELGRAVPVVAVSRWIEPGAAFDLCPLPEAVGPAPERVGAAIGSLVGAEGVYMPVVDSQVRCLGPHVHMVETIHSPRWDCPACVPGAEFKTPGLGPIGSARCLSPMTPGWVTRANGRVRVDLNPRSVALLAYGDRLQDSRSIGRVLPRPGGCERQIRGGGERRGRHHKKQSTDYYQGRKSHDRPPCQEVSQSDL